MPPYTLLGTSAAVVQSTLAMQPLPGNLRPLALLGLLALAAYACSPACRPRAFRLLLFGALATAAIASRWHGGADPIVAEHRTARYAATVLDRSGDDITLAFDNGLRVLARIREPLPAPGSRVIVRGRLTPFDEPRNPGEPSERSLQRERGYAARLASATVLSQQTGRGFTPAAWLARAHAWAHERLSRRLGEPFASVIAGELWGDRSALPPDLRAEFQETGTVHVLVTAGLHLGAVAALVVAVLSLLALPRALACMLAAACVWAFVWWSGGQLPAVRAATMATAALAARACGRATLSWNGLALAAIAIAIARPSSIATASFALSFSCVGAIFACAAPLERWIETQFELPPRIREALVLSLSTQLGTWPLSAAIFLQFAPYAMPANLGVVPCVPVTMALGMLQLMLTWAPPLAQAVANANSWLLAWMLGIVRTFATLPAAALPMTPAPPWCIAIYDGALLCAPALIRRRAAPAAVIAIALASLAIVAPPRARDARLRVTMIDVGQADAIAVHTPAGHDLLIDGGGRLERGSQGADSSAELVGERTVVPFLLRAGIHSLDAIVLSHPHGDHAGGIAPVLRRLRVTELADGGQRYGGHAYRDALAEASARAVPVVYPRDGAFWRTDDGVTLQFLGPSLPFIARSRNDINENSIAFVLRYRSFCMVFTGDAGAAAERRFLAEAIDLRCPVLKVGHHGSAYGTTPDFVAAVRPSYALISVGRHNLFGHPAPSTIATLQRAGAKIYRTDEDGAISLATDGSEINIETQRSIDPSWQ